MYLTQNYISSIFSQYSKLNIRLQIAHSTLPQNINLTINSFYHDQIYIIQ